MAPRPAPHRTQHRSAPSEPGFRFENHAASRLLLEWARRAGASEDFSCGLTVVAEFDSAEYDGRSALSVEFVPPPVFEIDLRITELLWRDVLCKLLFESYAQNLGDDPANAGVYISQDRISQV